MVDRVISAGRDSVGTMDIAELRERQAPLKELYSGQPEKAVVPLAATATWADPRMTTPVDTWAGPVRSGQHPALGGFDGDACSADMLLEALLACAGTTIRVVALAMRLEIRSATLRADSSFDARGSLGTDKSVPVGIAPVTVTAVLDTDADDRQLARLAELADRYCIVAQSMKLTTEIVIRRAAS